jgi:lactate racemase
LENLKLKITDSEGDLNFRIPAQSFAYYAEPRKVPESGNEKESLREVLENPVGTPPLNELLRPGMKVLILTDDNTRPTPKKLIVSVVVDNLRKAGIKDRDLEILIALGTHRYMSQTEILETFGPELAESIRISNHEWADSNQLVDLGITPDGTRIIVNKKVIEADFVIGVGSIVPHSEAGWSGGGKIIQPGVCGWETTGATHLLAATDPNFLQIAGTVDNRVRSEIEYIAGRAGLDFIVNVVLGPKGKIYRAVGGHPIGAHRKGVEYAKELYECAIPELAEVVVVGAYPADLDYWQGDKPVTYSLRGVKTGGVIILAGRFPEGVSQTHPLLERYGRCTLEELAVLAKNTGINDRVGLAALYIHAHHKAKATIICVSDGISLKQKRSLDLVHAGGIEEAIRLAREMRGDDAKIGVINYGGDLLPVLK